MRSPCQLCPEANLNMQQINLFLASCRIFSFSTISTPMPPSIAFLCYTTISEKFITHTGSVQASNGQAPPPPYKANILHHHALVSVLTIHRAFSVKEALYFETYQINYFKKKDICRYTKIQVQKINKHRQYNPELHVNISINIDIIISIIPYRVFNISQI